MNTLHRFSRVFAAAALSTLGSTGAFAQASWDLDACAGGTKAAAYTNCGGNAAANGTTVNVTAYSSTGAASSFTTASTSINNGGSYLGVWSGTEGVGAANDPSRASPHHAIDNVGGYGSSYELVHLKFSTAVDLASITANWTYGSGNADYQIYRYNFNAGTPNPAISFTPDTINSAGNNAVGSAEGGWTLVSSTGFGDNQTNITQAISDGTYNSSHWLIATKFGGSGDAFKLGIVGVANVCGGGAGGGGACAPLAVPEPATMAMVLLAGLAASSAARRRRV